jgi:SAM-dependent methyltransferase
VDATDASAEQIANARAVPNVSYSVQPAESTTFAPARFDAVCVAQAVHWFDLDRFYAEVKRVLKQRGILLLTAYGWSSVSAEVDTVVKRAVLPAIQPHWSPQNQLIIDGYRDLPFPFERIAFDPMAIEVSWTLGQYVDYIGTWTATRRLLEKEPGFLEKTHAALKRAWPGEEARTVTMPLVVVCGRHA